MSARARSRADGRGGAGLLFGMGLIAAAGLAAFWWLEGGHEDERVAREEVRPGVPSAETAGRSAPPRDPRSPAATDPAPAVLDGEGRGLALGSTALATDDDPARFRGIGSIRGHVSAPAGSFPGEWRLVIEPSLTLMSRDLAESRVVKFAGGEQDFHVSGLPLAGYDVKAVADGMNGYAQPVLLDRVNHSPFINLRLFPAGFLEGMVIDPNAAPLEGVPIYLEAQPTGQQWTTESDAFGRFTFPEVVDGQYKLVVGFPTSPIVEPQFLNFRAPSMNLPVIELPELASLDVLVVDAANMGVEGASVRGSGTRGGYLEGETEANGKLSFRYLPGGRYRIRASHPDLGTRRTALDLEPGEHYEEIFHLRKR